ncbi:MAG: hypothetical protein K8R99_14630 [Actinomycetia bacterium]|nr:hypothetical protein [Actinomycetes bacterium]
MSSERLEEERRFLLGSIRDLEREHEVGDVSADDYHALRDGYVARAAAVLRELEDGKDTTTPPPKQRWMRRLAIVGATLAIAAALGIFVAQSAGQRLPGQSLTGGQPADEVAVQLAEGRRLLNLGQLDDSIVAYERVQQLEPTNAEAATYVGWLSVLSADAASDSAGVQDGIRLLAEATTLDETYADPHCLLAVALHNFTGDSDPTLLEREVQACLALDPPADMVPMIEGLLSP